MSDRIQNFNKVPKVSSPALPAQKASVDPVPENPAPPESISRISQNYVLGMPQINNGVSLPTKIFEGANTDETIDNIEKKHNL